MVGMNLNKSVEIGLIEKTGWKLMCRRAPKNLRVLKSMNEILHSSSEERIDFYKRVGEKIFRQKLSGSEEASIVCLGGFSEIGRSAILIVTHESKILLDFGIKTYNNEDTDLLPVLYHTYQYFTNLYSLHLEVCI